MSFVLHHGDCLDVLRSMPSNGVDAIVTDPPYGLSFMGKKWDYDVPTVEVWAECLRVLKPGGHLLAFAGTRTQHRMAVRIEDAGFEIRDMIAWIYGGGFPKSLDVSKAIDKAHGAEREVIGIAKGAGMSAASPDVGVFRDDAWTPNGPDLTITAPATDQAKQWNGWGTALKPSLEPITLARKPLIGTVAANVMAHGTGALNIDGCRVGYSGTEDAAAAAAASCRAITVKKEGEFLGAKAAQNFTPEEWLQGSAQLGRWPANLIHDGSDEVTTIFPYSDSGSPSAFPPGRRNGGFANIGADTGDGVPNGPQYGDTGSASRFFYTAKASREDRDEGCANLGMKARSGTRPNTPDESGKFPDHDQRVMGANNHPTVKPTDLMRYLCKLVTPPGGTVLDPFAGSGSTGKAAVLENFNFIGIEREADYIAIAQARIECAQRMGYQHDLLAEA